MCKSMENKLRKVPHDILDHILSYVGKEDTMKLITAGRSSAEIVGTTMQVLQEQKTQRVNELESQKIWDAFQKLREELQTKSTLSQQVSIMKATNHINEALQRVKTADALLQGWKSTVDIAKFKGPIEGQKVAIIPDYFS